MSLRENSFLKIISIDLYELNLSKILKKNTFTIFCILSKNRLKIKTRTLINTKANSFIFLNTIIA